MDGGKARVLKNGDQDIAAVEIAVHPSDGNVIALIGDKGEVWIVDLLFDARVIQFNRDWAFEVANVHLLKAAWNPAGNRLYLLRKGVASESIRSFGRTSCMAADGDSLGKIWLTLHEEGELWEATADSTGNVQWNRIPEKLVADVGFDRLHDVSVSPLGTTAILTGENAKSRSSVLIDLVTRKMIKRWEGIALSSWHPDGEQIALCTGDGVLKVYRQGDGRELELQRVAGAENDGDFKVKRISWFRENLMNKRESQNTTWYIVAQVGERKLQFCSLEVNRNASEFEPIVLDSAITSIASSPMDSSLAIGVASGNISTWFASPSVDRQPRELFSIDTHRGAVVSDVRFSRDGNALFSADAPESKALSVNRGRVYGWVSMRLENDRLAPIAQKE